jgi:hypothetical protein
MWSPYFLISISSICSPPPTNTPPPLYLFYSPVFHFEFQSQCSKWSWCIPAVNILNFGQYNPSATLPYPFSSTPYYSTAFNTYHYVFCLHRCNAFWYCWLSFSFPFPHPQVPQSSSAITNMFYISMCIRKTVFMRYFKFII